MMAAPAPVRADPDGVDVGAVRPASTNPNPVTAPFPAAGCPEPQRQRAGSGDDDFGLWRRWSRGFLDNDAGSGAVAINNFTRDAAGQQGQAGGD